MNHTATMKHMGSMMEDMSYMMKGLSKVVKLDPMKTRPR